MINVVDKVNCCGCEACINICPLNCINMVSDQEGFSYPQVNTSICINCNLCEKVCPIINHTTNLNNKLQKGVIVQHRNNDILRQSTSGGAFTAIAEYVINNNGIVFGVEMGAAYTVHHIAVNNKEELRKLRNSKYVQSSIADTYKQVKQYLEAGKMVCFSGTPCQIEALKCFLQKDYEKLILVDVVCRAVPSPGVWKKYIHSEIEKYGKLQSVRFRDKTLGYQFSTMELINNAGKIYRNGIESQPWLQMYFSGMIIRPSCTKCMFRSQYRNSDFTIWDCFNIYKIDKSFNEQVGTTRMLIHTQKGKHIFKEIASSVYYKEIPVNILVSDVKEMHTSPQFHIQREQFYFDYQFMNMEELINKYFPQTISVKFKRNIRLFLNKIGLDKTIKHFIK